MNATSRRAFLRAGIGFTPFVLLLNLIGCSGSSEPTKIYEGGGTIPEIVETPEEPESKKTATKKK